MSPHRALNLTTALHPFAAVVYGMQAVLGVTLIFGLVGIASLEGLLLLPVVGLIMGGGGGVALYAILATTRATHKEPPMRLEQVAAWAVAGVNGFFIVALSIFYSWNTAVPTKVYVLGITIGCVWRAVQIRRERRRLRAAIARLAVAEPQLAEPLLAERSDPDQ